MEPQEKLNIKPVYDFSDCRNVETGAVFIIASGASAKNFPFERFSRIPMITMNGAISMFSGTGIKPYFYACTDDGFQKQQPKLFQHAMEISQRVVLQKEHANLNYITPNGKLYTISKAKKPSWLDCIIRQNNEIITTRSPLGRRARTIGFSKNMSNGFFDARTVAYLTIQLAYHIGFSKVFLVGVDLDQEAGRFYENEEHPNKSPCGLDKHFHTRILPSFKLIASQVISNDFMIYNLSASSRIPNKVIPRITFSEASSMLLLEEDI